MSLKRIFNSLAAIATVLVLNSFGLANHASAMPMSHEMGGMDHSKTSSNSSCVTLCTSAIVSKEDYDIDAQEENDSQPEPPYYALHASNYPSSNIQGVYYGLTVRPPPKVPIHILLGVSRR